MTVSLVQIADLKPRLNSYEFTIKQYELMLERMKDEKNPLTEKDYNEIYNNGNTTLINLLIGFNMLANELNLEKTNVEQTKEQRKDEHIKNQMAKKEDAQNKLAEKKAQYENGNLSQYEQDNLTEEIYQLTIESTAEYMQDDDSEDTSFEKSENEKSIMALMDKCTDVIMKILNSPHVKINIANKEGLTALDYASNAIKTLGTQNQHVSDNLTRCFTKMRELHAVLQEEKKTHTVQTVSSTRK